MVVVIEEIRAATDMASENGRFQREKIGEDSIGEWRWSCRRRRRKGPFLSTYKKKIKICYEITRLREKYESKNLNSYFI